MRRLEADTLDYLCSTVARIEADGTVSIVDESGRVVLRIDEDAVRAVIGDSDGGTTRDRVQ